MVIRDWGDCEDVRPAEREKRNVKGIVFALVCVLHGANAGGMDGGDVTCSFTVRAALPGESSIF